MSSTSEQIIPPSPKIVTIDRLSLSVIPNHPRKDFEYKHYTKLIESIKKDGLINPITVIKDSKQKNHYLVVDGMCRYQVCTSLGIEKIKCIILDSNHGIEWNLKANFMSKPFNPMEKSNTIIRFIKLKDPKARYDKESNRMILKSITQLEIARELGLSQSTVSQLISLQGLPDNIKEEQEKSGTIPFYVLRNLVSIEFRNKKDDLEAQYEFLKEKYTNQPINKHLVHKAISNTITKTVNRIKKICKDLVLDELSTSELKEVKDVLQHIIEVLTDTITICVDKISEINNLLNDQSDKKKK